MLVTHPKMNMKRVLQEYNRSFINWFRERILADDSTSKTLRLLVVGSNLNVLAWKGYDINNYSSTQSHRMIKVAFKIVGRVLMLIRITFVVHQIIT